MKFTHIGLMALSALRIVGVRVGAEPKQRVLELDNGEFATLQDDLAEQARVGAYLVQSENNAPAVLSADELEAAGLVPLDDFASTKLSRTWVLDRIAATKYQRTSGTTTICVLTHVNGFEIVGKSATVGEFDKAQGEKWAHANAVDKLMEFEAFALLERRKEAAQFAPKPPANTDDMPLAFCLSHVYMTPAAAEAN